MGCGLRWPPLVLVTALGLLLWAASTEALTQGLRRPGPPPPCSDHCLPGQDCRVGRRSGRVFCLGGLTRLNDDDDGVTAGGRRCRCRMKKGKRCRRRRSSSRSKSRSRSRSRSRSPCVCLCDRVAVRGRRPVTPQVVYSARLARSPTFPGAAAHRFGGPQPFGAPLRPPIYREQFQRRQQPASYHQQQQYQQQQYHHQQYHQPQQPYRQQQPYQPQLPYQQQQPYAGAGHRPAPPAYPPPSAAGGQLVHGPAPPPRPATCADLTCHGRPCLLAAPGRPRCVDVAERGRPRNRCRCRRRRGGSSSDSDSDSSSGSRSRSGGRRRCYCGKRNRSRSNSR